MKHNSVPKLTGSMNPLNLFYRGPWDQKWLEMIIKFCVSIYLVTDIIHLEQIRTNFIRSFVNAHIKANVLLDFVFEIKFKLSAIWKSRCTYSHNYIFKTFIRLYQTLPEPFLIPFGAKFDCVNRWQRMDDVWKGQFGDGDHILFDSSLRLPPSWDL